MCAICTAKAEKTADLSRYFREKSDEATTAYYVRRMSEVAALLDDLASFFSAKCRCGDDVYRAIDAMIPDGRILPSLQYG